MDLHKAALKSLCRVRRSDYQAALLDARSRIKEDAQKLRDRFGVHSVDYYEKAILQHRTGLKPPRTVSPWNAYLSREAKRLNDREFKAHNISIDQCLPKKIELEAQGENRKKVSELNAEISESWKDLRTKYTMDEIRELLGDSVRDIESNRVTRTLAVQNVPINIFHDVRSNVASIEQQVRN